MQGLGARDRDDGDAAARVPVEKQNVRRSGAAQNRWPLSILAPAANASPTGQRHSPGPRSVIGFAPHAGSNEKENSAVLPEEDEEVGGSPYAAFKAAIARAKDPSLSPTNGTRQALT
jgi:hypothetical protein